LGYFGVEYRCVILISICVTQIRFLKFETPPGPPPPPQ